MTLEISKKASRIVQAEIRSMSIECELHNGVNLAQGVCDTEVPFPVRRGAQMAIDEGVNSYTRYDGIGELRQAIARKMKSYNGIDANPDTDIVVSSGSTGSFYAACVSLLNPGDEVILFEPYYGYHVNTLLAVDAVPTYVRMYAPDWTFMAEDLENAVTPRTRGIMVNTPGNPSGKVFTKRELQMIAAFAKKHDLFVFTDEIYEYFLYDGREHISPATIDGMYERTITISGLSKTFSITGWRIGYSVCHEKWAKMIGYVNDLIYVCAPAPLQMGVAKGLDQLGADYYENARKEYAAKRELICSTLDKVGLKPCVPQGAYYVLADVTHLSGNTSKDKAMNILKKTGVASVPDEAFFHEPGDRQFVRFCFAKHDDELNEACNRLLKL
jgi:aminotransferase